MTTEIDLAPPPVHFAELTDAAVLNAALAAAYRRERDGAHVRRTHQFHGRFENTYIDAARLPELTAITQFVLRAARTILGRERLHFGYWFNEMQPGHRTSLHTHEELDELLSAVYYIECDGDCGDLVLHEEHARVVVTPKQGMLVLFPPDLPHEVTENRSNATRLSVAFNFGPWRPVT